MSFGPVGGRAVDIGEAMSQATENAIQIQIKDGRIAVQAMILNPQGIEDLTSQLKALEPFLQGGKK